LRFAQWGRSAAHTGLPHARRVRFRRGAGNRQCGRAFLTTDSGFPVNRSGRGAAHQPALSAYDYHPTLIPVLFGPTTGPKENKESRFHRDVHLATHPSAASIWVCPSSMARPPKLCTEGSSVPICASIRTCWISSAGCSRFATARRWCPAASASGAAWAELVGVSPDRGVEFFDKLLAKDDGWLASLFDCAGPHQYTGARLPDGSGAHEAFLRGGARERSPVPGRRGRCSAPTAI
jgi:hypothetical protein